MTLGYAQDFAVQAQRSYRELLTQLVAMLGDEPAVHTLALCRCAITSQLQQQTLTVKVIRLCAGPGCGGAGAALVQ